MDRACWKRYNKTEKGSLRRMDYYRRNKKKINTRRKLRYKAQKLYGNKWLDFIDNMKL